MHTAITIVFAIAAAIFFAGAFGLAQIGAGIEAGFLLLAGVYLGAKAAERLP